MAIATVEPWPSIRGCLESLRDQARATRTEIIVADGDGRALPGAEFFREIVWMRTPGASVYQLRAAALARARAEVLAFTEDHCRVAPDWCERILAAHAEHPEAGAIGGAVENGATGSTLDWVHFLIANGPYLRPNGDRESPNLTGQANVSFKRAVLPSEFPADGVMQLFFNRELCDRGLTLRLDDRLVAWHVQSLGWRGTCAMHFHTGRSIAGFRLPHLSRVGRLMRLASCAILPGYLSARTVATVFRKRRLRLRLLAGLPILALLTTCHAAGELAAYLCGPGDSARKVR